MPPFPLIFWMDSGSSSPPASTVEDPSPLWRLAERRSRKAGAGNIFSSVDLWQLQRLFRAAGDPDAEQRAQLVWGHRDEAELAQALIGLRARSHRRGLRTHRRDALESHWLRAFNHLRYLRCQNQMCLMDFSTSSNTVVSNFVLQDWWETGEGRRWGSWWNRFTSRHQRRDNTNKHRDHRGTQWERQSDCRLV